MGTNDVRLDPKLNQAVWAQGIKTVPHRLRVKLESAFNMLALMLTSYIDVALIGKRNDEEGAKEKLFTYVSHVPVLSFKVRTAVLISMWYISLLIRTSKRWSSMRSELSMIIRPSSYLMSIITQQNMPCL
jgi:hypothetical protein